MGSKFFGPRSNFGAFFEKSLRGSGYQLAEKLATLGVQENERNLINKISRGGFAAAFLLQCLAIVEANAVRLHESD